MSDRLSAFSLALLLATPLCVSLDGELLGQDEHKESTAPLTALSREAVESRAEGLQDAVPRDSAVASN